MDPETRELLLAGQLEPEELPEEIDLSELDEVIVDLWARSVARAEEGVVEEWAATIVRDELGRLRLINPVSAGEEFAVLPDSTSPPGLEFIGTFHTHPRMDGHQHIPFSDTDVISAVELDENLSLVFSYGLLAALVRTTRTTTSVDHAAVRAMFEWAIQRAEAQGATFLGAAWIACAALCRALGWALYVGPSGQPMTEVKLP
jgi:hypothetical protein